MVVGSFAVKQPSRDDDDGFVGLHQDLSFVDEPRFAGISLWCPLEEVDERNGCLAVVVGSHRFNSFYREPCSLPYPDLVPLLEHNYLTQLPMAPGRALLMDNRLFHESKPNRTPRTRLVAAGVAVPRESRLLYCHRDLDAAPDRLEVFEVPDDFYVRHSIGQRPREGHHAATVPRRVAELTADRLREESVAPG
jgi:ectoine hydroxylase-related dioxygenase (phytanoyl-CoA dioxygenase family)